MNSNAAAVVFCASVLWKNDKKDRNFSNGSYKTLLEVTMQMFYILCKFKNFWPTYVVGIGQRNRNEQETNAYRVCACVPNHLRPHISSGLLPPAPLTPPNSDLKAVGSAASESNSQLCSSSSTTHIQFKADKQLWFTTVDHHIKIRLPSWLLQTVVFT